MKSFSKEFLVGSLVILVVVLLVVFGWLMGAVGPFVHEVHYHLLYAFAGGVEVGSPVRVSGVKVGKVDKIEFLAQPGEPGDRATLNLTISVAAKAAPAVRRDSKFYVNMAGIIGERYIEISPGSNTAEMLPDGAEARGVDPPRIDQLLSQGYGLFGKIQDFFEENRETVVNFLNQMNKLMTDANKLLKGEDKRRLFDLVENVNGLTTDMRRLTHKLEEERAQKFLRELETIVERGSQVDKPALKKFLQDEGVRAHIF